MRLFVALWPSAPVRQALLQCRDDQPWPASARPTPSDKLHLTLHFIGQLPGERVAALAAALRGPVESFELQLDVVEGWPNGVTVLAAREPPPPLLRLHADLATRLRQQGLPVETRPWRAHVTLARHGRPSPPRPVPPVCWPVRGPVLVQSVPDGSYRVLSGLDGVPTSSAAGRRDGSGARSARRHPDG